MRRIDKPILCAGDLGVDISIDTRRRYSLNQATEKILQGEQITVTSDNLTKLSHGGTVGNTSFALGRLGENPLVLGKVGNDIFGDFLIKSLMREGVDTRWIIRDDHKFTVIVIAYTEPDGGRDFYIYPQIGSAYASLEVGDFKPDLFTQFGLMFTTGLSLVEEPIAGTILSLATQCKQLKIPVAFDINLRTNIYGWDQDKLKTFQELIDRSDIVFGSGADELTVVTENSDVFQAARLLAKGGKLVVCKSGKDGAAVYTENEAFRLPAFPVDVKDTIGVGDVFNSGFLSAYARGKSIRDCLLWGNAAAAYSLQYKGKDNSPTEEKLKQFIDQNAAIIEKIEQIY
jgi:fructokinase